MSLLDEPMSQLEPQLRAILRARIKDYLIQHKMTTVFVTHDQTEAMPWPTGSPSWSRASCSNIAPPAALKEQPANLFVASFIGEPPMNIVDVAVAKPDELLALDPAGQPAFRIPLARPLGIYRGGAQARHPPAPHPGRRPARPAGDRRF